MRRIANARRAGFKDSGNKTIQFSRAKGYEVFDTEGKAYVDFILGYGPVVLGHAPAEFNDRLKQFLDLGTMFPSYSKWHEDFVAQYFDGLDPECTALFFKTASEAVTAAIRLSAIHTQKKGVVRCGYIGWHDAQIADSINWHEPPASPARNREYAKGSFFRGTAGTETVWNWNSGIGQLIDIVDEYKRVIGAFVFDAYQFAFIDEDVVREAIDICRRNRISVIFDETKTGGRISKYGLARDRGMAYDFIVLGKSLANGAPLSMVAGRNRDMAVSELAAIQGTFGKELMAVYCAILTLEMMNRDQGYSALSAIGAKVVNALNRAARSAGVADRLKAVQLFDGGMFDLYFNEPATVTQDAKHNLPRFLADQNILLFSGHPSFVSLAHAEMDFADLEVRLARGFEQWAYRCETPEK